MSTTKDDAPVCTHPLYGLQWRPGQDAETVCLDCGERGFAEPRRPAGRVEAEQSVARNRRSRKPKKRQKATTLKR